MKIKLITASLSACFEFKSAWSEFKDIINLTYIKYTKAANFLIIQLRLLKKLRFYSYL